jgi:tetratricopeptide (TPR) repeat protein
MNTQHPPFVYDHFEYRLRERLDAALGHINTLSKSEVSQCDTKCLTELVKKYLVAPPLPLLGSMTSDEEVGEAEDITTERKTGHTNHSFFIPVEGEAEWLEEVRSQKTAVDDYPLAFLKRSRINIRLMLSPEDEDGALKRRLEYRARLVKEYADSVAAKLVEFNKDLAAQMLAEFRKRKDAIVKAERELENVGLPRVHNPEHAERAINIERLLQSLGAYTTDTRTQQSPETPQSVAAPSDDSELTQAERLYDKVKGLYHNAESLDENTARLIAESVDDAISLFGKTNQEKKVELKRIRREAEDALPPATVEELRKRAEGKALSKIHPKNKNLRNAVYTIIALIILVSAVFAFIQWVKEQSGKATAVQSKPTENANSPIPPISINAQAQQHIKRANDLYNNANFEEAIKECDEALALEPENQEALSLKTRINKTRGILNRNQ